MKDPDEARDIKLLNSDESSLTVDETSPAPLDGISPTSRIVASLPSSKGIAAALPKETEIATPEADAKQGNADSPQNPPHHLSLLLDL